MKKTRKIQPKGVKAKKKKTGKKLDKLSYASAHGRNQKI
jgi:hypothetical protein